MSSRGAKYLFNEGVRVLIMDKPLALTLVRLHKMIFGIIILDGALSKSGIEILKYFNKKNCPDFPGSFIK